MCITRQSQTKKKKEKKKSKKKKTTNKQTNMQLKHYAYVLFSHFCASSFLGRIYSSLFEKSAGTLHTTTSSFPPFRVFIFSLTVIDVFLCHCFFWILGRFPKCIPLFFPFSQPSGPLTLQPCSTSPNTKRHMLEKKLIWEKSNGYA